MNLSVLTYFEVIRMNAYYCQQVQKPTFDKLSVFSIHLHITFFIVQKASTNSTLCFIDWMQWSSKSILCGTNSGDWLWCHYQVHLKTISFSSFYFISQCNTWLLSIVFTLFLVQLKLQSTWIETPAVMKN